MPSVAGFLWGANLWAAAAQNPATRPLLPSGVWYMLRPVMRGPTTVLADNPEQRGGLSASLDRHK